MVGGRQSWRRLAAAAVLSCAGVTAAVAAEPAPDLSGSRVLVLFSYHPAFVTSRPFVTATIIGATRMEQLETNVGSAEITLSEEVLTAIENLHRDHTYPCP